MLNACKIIDFHHRTGPHAVIYKGKEVIFITRRQVKNY